MENKSWTWCILLFLLGVVGTAADGDFRLVDAVRHRDMDATRSLLKQHVDPNVAKGNGSTALLWAAHWNDLETAQLLLDAGAKVNVANSFGDAPLWEACNNRSAEMVEKLLSAGANPNAPLLKNGETALLRCARTGNVDAVKSLLDRGADVNAKENKGQTALMWALEEGHPVLARLLIERGADIQARSKAGFTALWFAARQGDVESASLLVERGADVNDKGPGGLTVLLLAIDSGREQFGIFLLEKGADPNKADPLGFTPLHYSLRAGITHAGRAGTDNSNNANPDYLFRPNLRDMVKALLAHGANPNARIVKGLKQLVLNDRPMLALPGATPFFLAAATADVDVMKVLLAKGADPNLATDDNTTPLMVAAGIGRWNGWQRPPEEAKQALLAVKLLVELGADVNASSNDIATNIPGGGTTALHGAALSGAADIAQFLVENGARIDAKDYFGMTPLSIAEGDPNHLLPDFSEAKAHENVAKVLRQLMDAKDKAQDNAAAVAPLASR